MIDLTPQPGFASSADKYQEPSIPIFEVWDVDGHREYGSVIGFTTRTEWAAKALALDRPGLHHELPKDDLGRAYLVHVTAPA